MMIKTLIGAVVAFSQTFGVHGLAIERRSDCAPFTKGTFNVSQYQLYPENADWDTKRCVVYFGALFNSTVAVYDPYQDKMVDIITFDGITRNPALHIGGVAADPYTGLLTVVVDAANPFSTGGRDVSGDNFIIKYDLDKKSVLWQLNITAVTGGKYGAFQDVEHDARGNTYIVGTYPGTVMRVDPEGKAVTPWYLPETIVTTQGGFGGLAATGDVLVSNANGQIWRFDMTAAQGSPTLIPRSPNTTIGGTDAVYMPPRYNGTVLLAAENQKGIVVLRSKDRSWTSAEHLGLVPNSAPPGFMVTAAVQIGNNLFMVEEAFGDRPAPGDVAGNRTVFPLIDITTQVEQLLAA